MSQAEQNSYMIIIPPEILLKVFNCLSPKHLAKCRLICSRWKQIIDDMFRSDKFWIECCQCEFSSIYKIAMYKARPGITWRNIYRSLFLWSRFIVATETVDEFASASNVREEIRDFQVLRNGRIAVHTRDGVHYYDVYTLEHLKACIPIIGHFTSYIENDFFFVIIDTEFNLIITRKQICLRQKNRLIVNNVHKFLLHDISLYYVTLNNEILVCNLNTKNLEISFLKKFQDQEQIMTLGYSNTFNVLTYEREIYSLVDKTFILQCNVVSTGNIQHVLWKYSLLERMDWRVYIQWMYILNRSIQHTLFKDMLIIYPYGDVFFVGTKWGVFRIYYKPFVHGIFDLYNSTPIKQYNFTERSDCPVLTMSPIFQIDVVEIDDGHKVFVAMPKKIAVLHYAHVFNKPGPPVLPFKEVQDIKILNVE